MTANPIDLIGGMLTLDDVPKADITSWAKARISQVFPDPTEVRNTVLAGQMVLFVKTLGVNFKLDSSDTTTPDDPVNNSCIVSLDGKRFKPISSIVTPTTVSLGGVFASAAVTHQFLTGIGSDGNVTRAQPAASDLSDGLTGTGHVVRDNAPILIAPVLGVATATSVNKLAITAPASGATLAIADGKTLTVSKTLTLDGTDGTVLTGPTSSQTLVGRTSTDTLTNKSLDASANTISNLTTAMFAANVVDTDSTLAANSNTRLATQAAVKSYVDNNLTGLSWKNAVACATTANITLSGEQTLDGVTTSASRVLVKNQTTGSQNGIYVSNAGAWTRSTDMDAGSEFPNATVFVQGGTVNADTQWTCSNNSVTVGTTAVVFAQVSGAGTYSAGTGLTLTGNQFAIDSTVATLTGAQALTGKTYNGLTINTTTGTLALAGGKTATISNTVTLSGTDGSTVAFGAGGTVAYAANNLSVFAATTSAQLLGVISDETGTGSLVFAGSPALTGTPTAPTAAVDISTTQLATTAFVLGQAAAATPLMDGTAAVGTSTRFARADHVHPVDTSRAPASGIALSALAAQANNTIVGNVSGSSAVPIALTATQVTAMLNAMVGDSGSGGTKGLVPAAGAGDAAAGKFLKADGTFAVPPGTGGGGALSDADRQNILLESIYTAKLFAGYRRQINRFADGYKATDGINAGSSSNFSVNTSGGFVAPSITETAVSFNTNSGSGPFSGNTYIDRTIAILNSVTVTKIGVFSTSAQTLKLKIAKQNSTTNFDIVADYSFAHPGGGYADLTLPAQFVVPATGTYNLGFWVPGNSDFTPANANRSLISGDQGVQSGLSGWTATSSAIVTPLRYSYISTINNMTVITTIQTADASVSNGRVLIEYDNSASPTLNTDLTVEVTCNGGTNWTAASLSAVTSNSQGGRKVAETVDQASTSGTAFAARIKTLTNKLIPVYGLSLTVH